jgi:hypothetical protein
MSEKGLKLLNEAFILIIIIIIDGLFFLGNKFVDHLP